VQLNAAAAVVQPTCTWYC